MTMRLSTRGLGLAIAVLWGGMLLLLAAAGEIWPPYGDAFLRGVASFYPGYEPGGWLSVLVVTGYGLLDGLVAGVVIAWLYNRFARSTPAQAARTNEAIASS